MTESEIEIFEKTFTQLEGLYDEIASLAKKSPNDAVNKFKLKYVNTTQNKSIPILGSKYRPYDDFHIFDEDDLPSNSDVAMILLQYINCMEGLRSDNINSSYTNWYWLVDGQLSSIRTAAPKKIGRK